MELEVYNINGEGTSRKVQLNESVFAIEPNDHAIYLDVKQYLANQRQGTHCSKEKWAIAGSTKKLKRQKGTGTARAGSIKSPVLRGGGRVFGPQPRDYGFKLNKKVKRLARKSALAYKATESMITVVEDFNFEAAKTKQFLNVLEKFDSMDKKVLFVTSESNKNVYLSSRNIKNVKLVNASSLNTYDILNAKKVFFAESALPVIDEIFAQ
ncbi:MAG: 50S ribosomal protein L4 [Bacteroidales bacterium]|nr:50S ribosomal protein L4 [Bacteroidales bacterium]